jgi:hypothetical protein
VSKPGPVAPPVYRPQSMPHVLQKKSASLPAAQAATGAQGRTPAAPAVYRPEQKRIVQPKAAGAVQAKAAGATTARKPPTAPPVYRPEQKRIVQPKLAATAPTPRVSPAASPVLRTPAAPGVLQQKKALANHGPMSRVIQRQLNGQELQELEAFYLREIREIGSPTSKKNRVKYAEAKNAHTLPAAKKLIQDHIAAWKKALDNESREPPQGPSLRSVTAGMVPISNSDLSSALGVHSPPKASLSKKEKTHFSFEKLKKMNARDRLYQVAEMASEYGMTLYELQKRANTMMLQEMGVLDYIDYLAAQVRAGILDADDIKNSPDLSLNGLIGVYYRYHKFADDPVSQQFVFGGGFNKCEIAMDKLKNKGVMPHFKDRHNALETLSTGTPLEQAIVMESAQANAFQTPFIATTSDRAYTRQLFGEYPPKAHQHAVVLTIIGPTCNTFDFEREFERLDTGFRLYNKRTRVGRSKDADQAEYGIPDIFIPVGKRSPLGFVIAEIEWL